ncbi:hypothetical protein [Salinispora arenicola]|uniref:hypothetical protein n=1 Tax=Salinispora arenicola TaxID=168697 RepID=UPI00037CEF8F|nr:hypothetical protein [Salinispora arenicola]
MEIDDLLLDRDVSGWLIYQMPDGREIRVDVDSRHPLHWIVDIPDGDRLSGQTTDEVQALLRHHAGKNDAAQ